MKRIVLVLVLAGLWAWKPFVTGTPAEGATEAASGFGLTIYNQGFAVVRQTVPLKLAAGINNLRFNGTTAHVEPESVILRGPSGDWRVEILEQNYRTDPISQELLLSLYEGQELEFSVVRDGKPVSVKGRIVRSGYVPHPLAWRRYGEHYYRTQMQLMGWHDPASGSRQPIVEVDGRLHFGLPGQPIFPALSARDGDDTILKPTLDWVLRSDRAGTLDAELSYVTGGMTWEADYNVVAPGDGDLLDVAGWVTFDNQSGKTFAGAQVKLMAGDVAKLRSGAVAGGMMSARSAAMDAMQAPAVTERTFDEYHLYTVGRRVTLRDRETKQVEFLKAGGVTSKRVYVYDGARIDYNRYQGYSPESILHDYTVHYSW